MPRAHLRCALSNFDRAGFERMTDLPITCPRIEVSAMGSCCGTAPAAGYGARPVLIYVPMSILMSRHMSAHRYVGLVETQAFKNQSNKQLDGMLQESTNVH